MKRFNRKKPAVPPLAVRQPWLLPGVRDFVQRALEEDIGSGDITSRALIDSKRRIRASIVARERYIVSGTEIVRLVCHLVDNDILCRILKPDGQVARPGESIVVLAGRARSILSAERTALNFLQHMTGIASLTAQFVETVKPYRAKIMDTRKTTPNMRPLEKYAVRCGGGHNHRLGLYDMILIKDNHHFLWGKTRSLADAVRKARRRYPRLLVEVEVESEAQLRDVMPAAPDWIMLDNMSAPLMKKCVALCRLRCRLEASGNVTLKNVKRIASTGVNAISIGSLTHSAPAADLALEVDD